MPAKGAIPCACGRLARARATGGQQAVLSAESRQRSAKKVGRGQLTQLTLCCQLVFPAKQTKTCCTTPHKPPHPPPLRLRYPRLGSNPARCVRQHVARDLCHMAHMHIRVYHVAHTDVHVQVLGFCQTARLQRSVIHSATAPQSATALRVRDRRPCAGSAAACAFVGASGCWRAGARAGRGAAGRGAAEQQHSRNEQLVLQLELWQHDILGDAVMLGTCLRRLAWAGLCGGTIAITF